MTEATTATPVEAAATSAPDPFSASRLHPEAARARTEDLFRRHGRLVVGLCRGLLRNAHEAEDAAQQTFLSVHGAFLRGTVPDDPTRWLTTIARNECLARIRERMRHPLPVEDADAAASLADPVTEAAQRADIRALWRAVDALAPQQREALLLREFGGLSYDELAMALGVSVPAVESLLFRARTRLRAELKAAAAALSGLLPRLLAGGGAAKVAGVTVAASLVTGGVVASEHQPTHDFPLHARVALEPSRLVLSDVPTARPARIVPPAAMSATQHAVRPRPKAQPVQVVFVQPARAPLPETDAPPAAEPQATDDGGGARTPVVSADDGPSNATVPESESDDSSTPATTTTTTATEQRENGGGGGGGSSDGVEGSSDS